MALDYWGKDFITTTVLASPTPTTTVFTVDDITDFVEELYINVEVSSSFERVQITDITGSQITVSPALSSAPDVPGEVRSRRQLLANSLLNNGALYYAATVAEVKALDVTNAPNNLKIFLDEQGIYIYDQTSSESADDFYIIQPTTGSGRWILKLTTGTGGGGDGATQDTLGTTDENSSAIEELQSAQTNTPTTNFDSPSIVTIFKIFPSSDQSISAASIFDEDVSLDSELSELGLALVPGDSFFVTPTPPEGENTGLFADLFFSWNIIGKNVINIRAYNPTGVAVELNAFSWPITCIIGSANQYIHSYRNTGINA